MQAEVSRVLAYNEADNIKALPLIPEPISRTAFRLCMVV